MQLIQTVELHKLYAGLGEDFFARHNREGLLQHSVIPRIAIMARIVDQRAVGAEQREVHAPRINSNAVQGDLSLAAADGKRVPNLVEQAQHVPIKTVRKAHWSVWKTVQLFQRELARVKGSENRAAALRAQIDGHKPIHAGNPSARVPMPSRC